MVWQQARLAVFVHTGERGVVASSPTKKLHSPESRRVVGDGGEVA